MVKKTLPAPEPIPEAVRALLQQQAAAIADLFVLVSRLQIKLDAACGYLRSRGMPDGALQSDMQFNHANRDPALQLAITSLLNAVQPAA